MRIARLELYGFKSFPDRTTFEFGPGISCVVGPNGSGKSNVVDAMRWCTGEQSARSLRGAEMLDVIFAGSADRAPVGFAEVRMTLSADTGEPFSGEYSQMTEVMVGRRLHRNGTSEYSINGVKCRRRDILELFLDTGVGNNLYSFIAQGQVERIVHASPGDRRAIIDEAAGISRYAIRRAEAQQRLEATGAQLDRAADVADEMERRLKILERQVVRAAEFRRLRARIRQEEIFLSLVRYRELAADRRALRERARQAQNEAAANRRELARRNNDLIQRREELAVVEAAAAKWRDEVAEFDARARELQSVESFQKQRAAELTEQAERQATEIASASEAVEREEAAIAETSVQAAALEAQLGRGAAAREARQKAASDAVEGRRAAREALAQAERAVQEIAAKRVQHQARVDGIDRDERAAAAEREQARESAARTDKDVQRRKEATRAVEAAVAEARAAVERARAERDRVARAASGARDEVDAVEAELQAAEDRLEQLRNELEAAVEQAARQAEDARRDAEQALVDAQRAAADAVAEARRDGARALQRVREVFEGKRQELEDVRETRVRVASEIAGVEGELRRVRAERDALAVSDDLGLDDPRPLLDRLGLDADQARELAERVGERVFLPVVDDADAIERVRKAVGGGQTRVLLAREGDPRERWDATWAVFDSISEAVSHHLEHGGGARAPGLRIDPDGVATIGPGQLEILARREQLDGELDRLGGELQTSREVLAHTGRRAIELLELERAPDVDDPVAWASDQLAEAERSALQRAEQDQRRAVSRAESDGDQAIDRARQAVQEAIDQAASARDRARSQGEAQIEQARKAVEAARAKRSEARQKAGAAAGDLDAVSRVAASAEVAGSRAEGELRLAQAAEREAATAHQGWVDREAALAKRLQELEAERVEVNRALAGSQTEQQAAQQLVDERAAALESAEQVEREAAAAASSFEAHASALEERLVTANKATADARSRADEARRRRERSAALVQELREASEAAGKTSEQARVDAAAVAEQRGEAWDKLQRERTRLGKLRESLQKAEEDGRQLQEKATELAGRIAELEASANQVRSELEILRRNVEDRYQVALSGLLDRIYAGPVTLEAGEDAKKGLTVAGKVVEPVEDLTFTRPHLEDGDRIAALVESNQEHRAALARLGEVNLGALEEYSDLSERYADLISQREDLEASVTDIRRAIAKMNRTCRQRFRDAFDRVNEYFQEVYPRLVGGGSARLSLTDEEDLLQTGVEIYVQPPGKRLQNLTLLSGGEKAMTAIALLISLFKVKPSPFCVLDEVDAPLDEANGSRFNDILREMSSVSQFVVITHNRKTMECADTLYGVTMGRPGVSSLVSVNMAG